MAAHIKTTQSVIMRSGALTSIFLIWWNYYGILPSMLPIGKETPGVPHVPPAEWFIAKPVNQNHLIGDFSPEFENQFGPEVRELLWRVNHFLSDHSIKEVREGKMITYSYEELLLKYPELQAVDACVHLWIAFTPEELLEHAHKLDYYAPRSHSKQPNLS